MIRHGPSLTLACIAALSALLLARCAGDDTPTAITPDVIRLPVTSDTTVSSYPGEEDANLGGKGNLKLKGFMELILLDVDVAALRGKVIREATLRLRPEGNVTLRRVTVSTLASPWREGTSSRYSPQRGGASFRWAMQDERPWAWDASDDEKRSDLTAVINSGGHTLWRFADAAPADADGFQSIAVEPAVLAARVAGVSHGFAVMDDVGSEWRREGERFIWDLLPNRFVSSREAGPSRAPFFTVLIRGEDHQPPAAVRDIIASVDDMPAGEAIVTWTTPEDRGDAGVVGFFVRWSEGRSFDWDAAGEVPRYLVPLAGRVGAPVRMRLRDLNLPAGAEVTLGVRAVDGAGNVGELTTATFQVSARPAAPDIPGEPMTPFRESAPPPQLADITISVLDPLDKVHPVTGQTIPAQPVGYLSANHLWSAKERMIRLTAARNEFVAFQLVLSGRGRGVEASLRFADDRLRGQWLRLRYVESKAGPLPDPLTPIIGAIDIPDPDNRVPGQKHTALLADIYVPHEFPAGIHRGELRIVHAGQVQSFGVELRVWNFTLPDFLSFVPQMNSYGGMSGGTGSASHRAYYRLAHAHRTCLNLLPYNWAGGVRDGYAPTTDGQTWDWTRFDTLLGPLLDGSAFADLPRRGVPVDAFYLPLNENWPAKIEPAYRGGYWIDEALRDDYRAAFVDAARRFAQHLDQRRWYDTTFEFYLNNKVYYKQGGWEKSSALWVFDEPVNTQDFWALRWFGLAFHEGVNLALGSDPSRPVRLAFRADVSRPQWQRDLLDGLMGVNVVGGPFYEYTRLALERKRAHGEIVYVYGTTGAIERSNVQPAAWCIDAWCRGVDGVLPWQTIGNEASWRKADTLSLFYPGAPAGLTEPAPSIRLKSFRRGQQDVEYLVLLAEVLKQPRWAVGAAARRMLALRADTEAGQDDKAQVTDFGDLNPMALWRLRTLVGSVLDRAGPPAKRRLVEQRPPTVDGCQLPEVGQVSTERRR